MENGLFSWQETKNPDGTNSLTQNSSNCSTAYAQVKYKNKNRIQNNVDHRTDHSGHHTDLCKSLCGDKGIHSHYDQDKNTSQYINSCVWHSIRKGLITGTKHCQKLWRESEKNHRKGHSHKNKKRETVSKNLFRCRIVLFPHGNCGSGSTSWTCEHGKGINQHKNWRK